MLAERYQWTPDECDDLPADFAETLPVMIHAWGKAQQVHADRQRPRSSGRVNGNAPGSMAGM